MITNLRSEFVNQYATAIQLYEKAQRRLAEGDADDTLTAARKSLEFFLKDFSTMHNLPVYDGETGAIMRSEELINTLTAWGYLKDQEPDVLHQLRKLGNVGSHEIGSMAQAQQAVSLLEQTVLIFSAKDAIWSGRQETAEVTQDYSHLSPRARRIAKSPFLYHMFSTFAVAILLPGAWTPLFAIEYSAGPLLTALSLMVTIVCMLLHSEFMARVNAMPVPEKNRCKIHIKLIRLCSVIAPLAVLLGPVAVIVVHPSIIVKILALGTAVLCVYINPVLQNIFKKLRDRIA